MTGQAECPQLGPTRRGAPVAQARNRKGEGAVTVARAYQSGVKMRQHSPRVADQGLGCWRFGPFELDERRFELRRAGQPLSVQPKVIDLLIYLVRHRDRVVSKDELLDNVWPDVTVCEASLSQAISLARKELRDGPRLQRYLRTVRGRGFQFVAPLTSTAFSAAEWSQPLKLADGEQRCLIVRLVGGQLEVLVLPGDAANMGTLRAPGETTRLALVAAG